METTNWRSLIAEEMALRGESFDDVVSPSLDPLGLNASFANGTGQHLGKPFLLWTRNRVYFAVVELEAQAVSSVPRDPSEETPETHGVS